MKEPKMKRVQQQGGSECGVACLAMLADVDYAQAKAFMSKHFPDARLTSSGKIVAGLKHFQVDPLQSRCRTMKGKRIEDLPNDALVMVSHRRGQLRGDHWVVWDKKRKAILDPWESGLRVYPFKYMLVR